MIFLLLSWTIIFLFRTAFLLKNIPLNQIFFIWKNCCTRLFSKFPLVNRTSLNYKRAFLNKICCIKLQLLTIRIQSNKQSQLYLCFNNNFLLPLLFLLWNMFSIKNSKSKGQTSNVVKDFHIHRSRSFTLKI